MLQVALENPVLKTALSSWFEQPLVFINKCNDFDGFSYVLMAHKDDFKTLMFTISADCLHFGLAQKTDLHSYLSDIFPGLLVDHRSEQSELVLCLEHDKLPSDENERQTLLSNLCSIRSIILGAPIDQLVMKFEKKEPLPNEPFAYRLSSLTSAFVQTSPDSIMVTFGLHFTDSSDLVLIKPFLQELVDARKISKFNSSPPVSWQLKVPSALETVTKTLDFVPNCGYVTFALFDRHWKSRKMAMIHHLVSFKDFLVLHLKAMKAEQHVRLRKRFTDSLALLNRAKPSVSVE
ncbi:hypothetical protein P9112_011895 [Eukaryota sp. TZLM1-RC]